ncbi:MAG: CBS domain-containing protein [bacterium]|nr:CBS domain-containing protein [bacterium]
MLPVSVLLRNRPEPYLLDAELSVAEAASFLRKYRIGGAPVLRDGELVGFASERDIVYRVVAEHRDLDATKVADVMSTPVVTATLDDTVEQCEQEMRRVHVRHMPVVDGGAVVACLSLRDLMKSELRQAENDVRSLTEYVHGSG